MLDRNLVANHLETVKTNLHRRNANEEQLNDLDKLSAVITRRRELQTQTDSLRSDRKRISKQIGGLMREKKFDEAEIIRTNSTGLTIYNPKNLADRIKAMKNNCKKIILPNSQSNQFTQI